MTQISNSAAAIRLVGASDDASTTPAVLKGRALYLLVGLLLLVQILDGVDMNALAYVGSAIMKDLQLSKSMLGACIGIAFLGMAGGAVFFGWLGDRIGRRFCILLVVALFGAGSLATAFSPNAETLFVLRLLTGLALGGLLPVASSLLVERSPAKVRTTAVTAMTIGTAGGAAVCGVISSLVVPEFGWRSLFLVGGTLPLLLLPVLFLFLPRDVVASRRSHVVASKPVRPSLFRKGAWRITLPCWGALFFGAVPVFFIIGWLPTLAKESGASQGHAALATSLGSIMGALGGVCLARAADRFGFKSMLIGTLAGAVCSVLLGSAIGGGALFPAAAAAGFFLIGRLTVIGAASGQFYVVAIRGFAIGCGLGLMRVGAALSPWLAGLLLDAGLHLKVLFWVGGGCVIVSGILLQLMVLNPVVHDQADRNLV
jgi:AAHS family 4-hydroxybenzoate transporter-like MFS transporter